MRTNYLFRLVWQIIAAGFLFASCPVGNPTMHTTPLEPCHEDMPCWNWRTMGNRCGRDRFEEPIRCIDEAGNEVILP